MTDKMKPPPRSKGRALGATAKKTAPPPPPPTAELTPEQFAAEQAAAQTASAAQVGTSQVRPSAFAISDNPQAEGHTNAASEERRFSAAPAAHPPTRVREPAGTAISSSQIRLASGGLPVAGQEQAQTADHAPRNRTSHNTRTDPAAAGAAEVAVHSAALPPTTGTTFPVRDDVRGLRYEQDARAQPTASEGTPWTHGPGRPTNIPETAVILNQRIIARESLDSSVPAALKLKKRIKRFALDNELDHLPIGDIVSVALDEWLTTRGF
ncbi:hypothetical protein ACJWDR_18995 [Streptomyces tauricus]|uniref:hypothetical protein n=1 Tax=Streptomyces tauricus TaxID=68274 RepID=UPI00387EFB0C